MCVLACVQACEHTMRGRGGGGIKCSILVLKYVCSDSSSDCCRNGT